MSSESDREIERGRERGRETERNRFCIQNMKRDINTVRQQHQTRVISETHSRIITMYPRRNLEIEQKKAKEKQ